MSKIGILYLATGPYISFWKKFYETYEKHFLNNSEIIYYVFTDADKIYAEDNKCVRKYNLASNPWPLVTLLRFHTFLSIEDDLKECDYLMFFNANIACDREVKEEEILPQGNKKLFVTTHPAFKGKHNRYCPFERNKKSTAYVPYNIKTTYVIGAALGGQRESFLKMCREIKKNIDEDLKRNYIAIWHDESHLNRYIIGRNDVNILSVSYCYPYGMDIEEEKVIYAVGKKEVFDIDTFKGIDQRAESFMHKVNRKLKPVFSRLVADVLYLRDTMEHKK